MWPVRELTAEVGIGYGRRIQPIISRRRDSKLNPGNKIEKGRGKFSGREIAMVARPESPSAQAGRSFR